MTQLITTKSLSTSKKVEKTSILLLPDELELLFVKNVTNFGLAKNWKRTNAVWINDKNQAEAVQSLNTSLNKGPLDGYAPNKVSEIECLSVESYVSMLGSEVRLKPKLLCINQKMSVYRLKQLFRILLIQKKLSFVSDFFLTATLVHANTLLREIPSPVQELVVFGEEFNKRNSSSKRVLKFTRWKKDQGRYYFTWYQQDIAQPVYRGMSILVF